jgi:hypothetical protein
VTNPTLRSGARETPPTLEEIRRLTDRNLAQRDEQLERKLLRMRHDAFAGLAREPGLTSWPPPAPPMATDPGQVPVVNRDALDVDTMRAGVLGHGCLWVKGLFEPDRVNWFTDAIDQTFAAHQARQNGTPHQETGPWYRPFRHDADGLLSHKRQWVIQGGGMWAADSPPAMFELIETMENIGMTSLIEAYLGERPVLSVDKCTLRRVPLTSGTDWHQDGAFLGDGIRTLNCWIALSDCGVGAPGLDIVPRRMDRIVETGTEGAWFDWAVGQGVVDRVAEETPVLRPEFEAGDALLFDDMFLHRTAISPAMTHERYAIESWFFAPSSYPADPVPIVL